MNLGAKRNRALPEGQREKWKTEWRKGEEDAAREKGRAARGATKVAVTLYKASKLNKRGPKGKKTRRSALRGDAKGNGGVHEEEARMDGRRRWQGCKLEAVVPRRTTVRVSYSRRNFAEIDERLACKNQSYSKTGNNNHGKNQKLVKCLFKKIL